VPQDVAGELSKLAGWLAPAEVNLTFHCPPWISLSLQQPSSKSRPNAHQSCGRQGFSVAGGVVDSVLDLRRKVERVSYTKSPCFLAVVAPPHSAATSAPPPPPSPSLPQCRPSSIRRMFIPVLFYQSSAAITQSHTGTDLGVRPGLRGERAAVVMCCVCVCVRACVRVCVLQVTDFEHISINVKPNNLGSS
jgi:hypothetical protein